MNSDQILPFAWGFTLSMTVMVITWVILVMQAFFHDKRIALIAVFGASVAALAMAVSASLSYGLLYLVGAGSIGLLLWFVIKQLYKPAMMVCTGLFCLSAILSYWFYVKLTLL